MFFKHQACKKAQNDLGERRPHHQSVSNVVLKVVYQCEPFTSVQLAKPSAHEPSLDRKRNGEPMDPPPVTWTLEQENRAVRDD